MTAGRAPGARFVRDQAVVVVPLVLPGARLGGRVGLRPGEEALEDRVEPEHPSRRLVPRDDGVLDAEPREAVARLQAARPAPDDDDGIVPRRKRPLVLTPLLEDVAEPARHGLQHPVGHVRVLQEERLELRPGDLQAVQGRPRDDVGGGLALRAASRPRRRSRPAGAGAARRPGISTAASPSRMTKKPAAGEPAPEDALALAEAPLPLGVGDRLEIGLARGRRRARGRRGCGRARRVRSSSSVRGYSARSRAAKKTASEKVGKGWIVSRRTSTGTSARIASVSWPIHSPASGPTAVPRRARAARVGVELDEPGCFGRWKVAVRETDSSCQDEVTAPSPLVSPVEATCGSVKMEAGMAR